MWYNVYYNKVCVMLHWKNIKPMQIIWLHSTNLENYLQNLELAVAIITREQCATPMFYEANKGTNLSGVWLEMRPSWRTMARLKTPPIPVAPSTARHSEIRRAASFELAAFLVDMSTSTPLLLHWLTLLDWNPDLMPDLEVSTSFLAPLLTNHCANSRPKPPRPPTTRYTLPGWQATLDKAFTLKRLEDDFWGDEVCGAWGSPRTCWAGSCLMRKCACILKNLNHE